MIEIFKKNLFINSLLLLPYAILLRLPALLYSQAVASIDDSMTWAMKGLGTIVSNFYGQQVLVVLLIYYQAIYINRLCIKHRLAPEITLFPGVFYIWLCALMPDYSGFNSYLLSNTFVIIALGELFRTYKKPLASTNIFNVGFWVSMATIFTPYYAIFLIVGVIGFFILRSFKGKEILQFLCGAGIVYFIIWSSMYLSDADYSNEWKSFVPKMRIGFFDLTQLSMTKFVLIVSLSIFALLNYRTYTLKKSIQAQKKVDILYWLMIISGIGVVFLSPLSATKVFPLYIALSIFLSINFSNMKKPLTRELVHLVMLGLIAVVYYVLG